MFIRTIVLVAGLSGALGAAQFPAFSQQYMQRLGGAVDALAVVVANFDASAKAVGLSRHDALAQMTGTPFMERRRADMRESIARHEALRDDLAVLEGQGPFMRAYYAGRFTDPEIARGALKAFEPAFPLTLATGLFAAFGFVMVGGLAAFLASFVRPKPRPHPLPA